MGGMNYSFDPDGEILDTDRYYWVLSETFASAALLACRTGNEITGNGTTKCGNFLRKT
ncbi:MAG: hypothetical protein CM1200mP3_01530 [Chloroflexota bacterium]|nr:MAG: hypothetical protein CM1200mP3_01530 [Chloroflexota bacterium]